MPVMMAGLQPKLAPLTGGNIATSGWFQPGLVAGWQVLLSGSPPASDSAGMWRISFDVPRQWCDRRNCHRRPDSFCRCSNLAGCFSTSAHQQEKKEPVRILHLLPPPPAVTLVFMFWLGFNIWCLELWRFSFLPSFECECEFECCPEKTWAAEEKHFIPLSNHKIWLWSNLRMQQSRIYLPPPTLGRVFLFSFFFSVRLNMVWRLGHIDDDNNNTNSSSRCCSNLKSTTTNKKRCFQIRPQSKIYT